MFRRIVLCAFLSLSATISLAQFQKHNSTVSLANDKGPDTRVIHNDRRSESISSTETRISLVRLKEPPKARRLYQQAMKAWINQRRVEAERKLDEALKIYPNFPEALAFYGGIYGELQLWTSAERSLRTAIEVDPQYSPAYVVMAGIYNAQKRFDDAQAIAQQGLSVGDCSSDVYYEIARALIGKGQYERALVVAETGLGLKKHGSLLHVAKAHALIGLGKYRPAVRELQAFVHYQPEGDASVHARYLLNQLQSGAGE